MSRIADLGRQARRNQRKLLIPYLVAGDPDLAVTLRLMHELVARGADIIELGVPFSDPASDGPVIQRGAERTLAGGATLAGVLSLVEDFRRTDKVTPVVLMGYLNPIEVMGYEKFAHGARTAGVDGVLVVDMPPMESAALHGLLRQAGIDTIYLVAPTTKPERARVIAAHSTGYLYYVSLKGVTGAALTDRDSVRRNIAGLRELTDLPIVIGFGIKDGSAAAAMAALADGVVIGSALVDEIAALDGCGEPSPEQISTATGVIREARKAMDNINR